MINPGGYIVNTTNITVSPINETTGVFGLDYFGFGFTYYNTSNNNSIVAETFNQYATAN